MAKTSTPGTGDRSSNHDRVTLMTQNRYSLDLTCHTHGAVGLVLVLDSAASLFVVV